MLEEELLQRLTAAMAIQETSQIDEKEFHPIPQLSCEKKIAYVDGGNATIAATPNAALEFIRLYYTVYQGMKRIKMERHEFYAFTTIKQKDGKLAYATECFPEYLPAMEFDLYDRSMRQGNEKIEASFIGGIVRKVAELQLLHEALESVADGFAIRDGDLEVRYPYEEEIMKSIAEKAKQHNIGIGGLCKTSTLLTETGNAMLATMAAVPGAWHHQLHGRDTCVVKLHPKSSHAFRLDFIGEKMEEALAIMKEHSTDISVLGYPYPLFEADRFAKVSNTEKEQLKLKFKLMIKDRPALDALEELEFHAALAWR